MNFGTRRSEAVPKPCGAAVLEGLGTWDFVDELSEADGVDVVDGAVVRGVDSAVVRGVDGAVVRVVDSAVVRVVDSAVVGSVVGAVDGTLAPAPAQPATINVTAAAPATERAAYQRCCPTGTQASEPNDAKWSKLGMMTW